MTTTGYDSAAVATAAASQGISWQPGVGYVVGAPSTNGAAAGGSGAPTPPAGIPANATWNGTNWQWAGGPPTGGNPVSAAAAQVSASIPNLNDPGSYAVATGFPMYQQMFQNLLDSEKLRQSAVDQQISLGQLFTSLTKSSPSQAAELAVKLGLPSFEPNFDWTKAFSGPASLATIGGQVGSQQVQLPFSFSGQQLDFLHNNQNVAQQISDLASFFGTPDLLSTSLAGELPTNASLIASVKGG